MRAPTPTPIYRIIHMRNLPIYLARGAMHSANHWPNDGLEWQTNHDEGVQSKRARRSVECGPGGTLHDYVPFYFGPLSPMMLRLKTGRVVGYTEGQEPLIYLVSTAQAISEGGVGLVFTDGHGIDGFTKPFDKLDDLGEVDWGMVGQRYWRDTLEDGAASGASRRSFSCTSHVLGNLSMRSA